MPQKLRSTRTACVSVLALSFSAVFPVLADTASDAAIAAVKPLLAEMGAAANAHDVDRHVGMYAHDPGVMLIYDGEDIVGWQAIYDQQKEWWQQGKTDVVYSVERPPVFSSPVPGIVLTTLFMKSSRTLPSGETKQGFFAVSSVWQKRPEGWRIISSHESTSH